MAKPKSKKGRKLLVFSLIVVVVGSLTTVALLRKKEAVITIQTTEKVGRRNLTELVVANGRIQPVFQVKISPEVSGEIIELPVKEGQKVKKGDLLLKIKPDMYVAAKHSSEAGYRSSVSGRVTAEASLEKAEIELRRIEALHQSRLVSDSELLTARTSYNVAKSQHQGTSHQVEMAEASRNRADEDLAKTTIVSPLDGTVSRLNSQLGERVVGTAMMAGTEVMTIADLNEMEARVDIGEIDVVLIQPGQNARLEVDAFKDRKFNGTVTEIANSSKGAGYSGGQSQDATKFEVKVRIKEKEPFRPGMSVTAEIETRQRTNVLAVPIASVTTRLPKPPDAGKGKNPGTQGTTNGTNRVSQKSAAGTNTIASTNSPPPPAASTNLIAGTNSSSGSVAAGSTNAAAGSGKAKPNDAPKPIEVVFTKDGERVKMVPVKLGISDDTHTEILEGLEEGQEVVSGGYKALRLELEDGKKVRMGTPGKGSGKDQEKPAGNT